MDKLKKILEEKGMVFEGVQGGDGMSYIVPQKMPLLMFMPCSLARLLWETLQL